MEAGSMEAGSIEAGSMEAVSGGNDSLRSSNSPKARIKRVAVSELLEIRNRVLWPFLSLQQCHKEWDRLPGTFHLGLYEKFELISIASFLEEALDVQDFGADPKGHIRLRAMATHSDFQGKGYGRDLLSWAIQDLRSNGKTLLWCHAREKAFPFYHRLGFRFFGDFFDIENIGPHRIMYLTFY